MSHNYSIYRSWYLLLEDIKKERIQYPRVGKSIEGKSPSWRPRDYLSVHIPRLGLVSLRFLLRWRVFRWMVPRFVYHQGLIY